MFHFNLNFGTTNGSQPMDYEPNIFDLTQEELEKALTQHTSMSYIRRKSFVELWQKRQQEQNYYFTHPEIKRMMTPRQLEGFSIYFYIPLNSNV